MLVLLILIAASSVGGLDQDTLKPNSQGGVVVGDRGFICTTFDGGYEWSREELPAANGNVNLQDAFMLDDHSAIAVGGDCSGKYQNVNCGIFRRAPGRPGPCPCTVVTWSKMPLGPKQGQDDLFKLQAVTFCSATLGLVVGDRGRILRSVDAGATWNVISSGVQEDLHVVHCVDENVIVVAGDKGAATVALLRSEDGGRTWRGPATSLPASLGRVRSLLMQGQPLHPKPITPKP